MAAVEEKLVHTETFEIDVNSSHVTNEPATQDCKSNGLSEVAVDGALDNNTSVESAAASTPQVANSEALQILVKDATNISTNIDISNTTEEAVAATIDLGTNDTTANVACEGMDSSIVSETIDPSAQGITESDITDNQLSDAKVSFETEVVVENVEKEEIIVNDTNEIEGANGDNESENKILTHLKEQNINFSEALGSSHIEDTSNLSENIESNSTSKDQVFNKEELLDILEGNDVTAKKTNEVLKPNLDVETEAQMALKQLESLRCPKGKKSKLHKSPKSSPNLRKDSNVKPTPEKTATSLEASTPKTENSKKGQKENILKTLVNDWSDDEPDDDKTSVLKESDQLLESTEEIIEEQKLLTESGESNVLNSSNSVDGQTKSRACRVIKKKVIFDPDNPDTFTKGKGGNKVKEADISKEQTPVKKPKIEQTPKRSSSKSPLSKTQWKKPTPKNSKSNHKRLSEVDRLLMDEGAVNMIYQLTPEASKVKRNTKTKAELIKKINQTTTDGVEMKFRERKKDVKLDEVEAKKLSMAKQRGSVTGSVKSISVGEDFETHSADDSIIYRRHSSSSYSSTCMSPRRLSDVESGSTKNPNLVAQTKHKVHIKPEQDIFTVNDSTNDDSVIINKSDCLSLKEKLNSKLSNVLSNKRKREIKNEKPVKQKKISLKSGAFPDFTSLTLSQDKNVAEIVIKKNNLSCTIEEISELQNALTLLDDAKDVSVIVLYSESGVLLSNLELSSLLQNNIEEQRNYALQLTETIGSLLLSIENHSKFIITGLSGNCQGLTLGICALSDMVLVSDDSTFSFSGQDSLMLTPIVSALRHCQDLQQSLVRELVMCSRRVGALEAVSRGLASRAVWPAELHAQLASLAASIASQPAQLLLLKKKLLNLTSPQESTFQSCLALEQDLVAAYWTSVEGQESLQSQFNKN